MEHYKFNWWKYCCLIFNNKIISNIFGRATGKLPFTRKLLSPTNIINFVIPTKKNKYFSFFNSLHIKYTRYKTIQHSICIKLHIKSAIKKVAIYKNVFLNLHIPEGSKTPPPLENIPLLCIKNNNIIYNIVEIIASSRFYS